ncbi:unnamed protein product [Meloidogyne enterolobii]|uniref:Uncharacterized protein n=1 Tax=Meloidogyne enterolobii TaxID=390850 RepID=A0ACB0XUB8_MELEN
MELIYDLGWRSYVINIVYQARHGQRGLVAALDRICKYFFSSLILFRNFIFSETCSAALDGYQILILSDRQVDKDYIPISALLATGAVHICLIKQRLCMKVALIIESGQIKQVHDFCVLLGYGADAICPCMVYETCYRLRTMGLLDKNVTDDDVVQGYKAGIERGIYKVVAKIGISTLHSYKAVDRLNDAKSYQDFAIASNLAQRLCSLRGQLEIKTNTKLQIPLDQVEPASEIVKRFVTGAMSFGVISMEAYTSLVIAMNKIGAKSNKGEGGERPERYRKDQSKDNNIRSAIKQVSLKERIIGNINRCFGARPSYEISIRYGEEGLPERHSLEINLKGSAGQSFCAFLAKVFTVRLDGEANDYVGKCLSGGEIIIRPYKNSNYASEENTIIGNVALYGSTSGTAFFRGFAGERFAVRNSGATSGIEGVSDHGCEYMTSGRVIILCGSGKNFAAALSGVLSEKLEVNL